MPASRMETHSFIKVVFQVSVKRVLHHLLEDRPEDDDPVGAVAERRVGRLDRSDEGGCDVWAVLPAFEHSDALAHQPGGVAADLPDRLAEGEDVSRARLGDRGGLREGEDGRAVGLDLLGGEGPEGAQPVSGAGDLDYDYGRTWR